METILSSSSGFMGALFGGSFSAEKSEENSEYDVVEVSPLPFETFESMLNEMVKITKCLLKLKKEHHKLF
jgi:hypothetical protein